MASVDYSGTVNGSTYSGKQFNVYIAEDDTIGAINSSSNGSEYQRIDVEGVTLPTFTPNQEFEMRTGSGRVAEFDAMFSSSKGVATEFTLSGRLDLGSLPIFVENVLGTNGSGNQIILPAGGYAPANIANGAAVGADEWHLTLSVYFEAPSSTDSYALAGCVCTNLQLSADMGTASGRYDYTATFQTRYVPSKGTKSMSSATSINTTNVFLSDQSYKTLEIFNTNAAGDDFTSINPLFNSLSITFDAPTVFLGAQGTNAEPEVVARSVPELSMTMSGSVKYDAETDSLLEAHRDPAQTSFIQFYISNIDVSNKPSSGAVFPQNISIAANADQELGWIFHRAKLISASVGSGDVASLDFEAKIVDPATATYEIFHISTGATA